MKQVLKKHLKDNIADIFLIGSSIKDKLIPADIDIIVLLKEKNLRQVEDALFKIKEDISFIKNLHMEPLFLDTMFDESIFLTVLHEGFSIKENKFVSEIMNLKSYVIFSYGLENLSKIDKVRFAQALYGRNGKGLLSEFGGVSLGSGSFMVDVSKEELFKEFFKKWKVIYTRKRAFVSD